MSVTPLSRLMHAILSDTEQRAAVTAAPDEFLRHHGYVSVTGSELAEAVAVVADTSPPDRAEALQTAGQAWDLETTSPASVMVTLAAVPTAAANPDDDGTDPEPADGGHDGGIDDAALAFGSGSVDAPTEPVDLQEIEHGDVQLDVLPGPEPMGDAGEPVPVVDESIDSTLWSLEGADQIEPDPGADSDAHEEQEVEPW